LNPEICEVVSPKGPILDLIVITRVSTTATLDHVRHYLALMYPVLRMGRETRWLPTDATKLASSVVIRLFGKLTTKNVLNGARFFYLFNLVIRLTDYIPC
jgi:hypothetical protein